MPRKRLPMGQLESQVMAVLWEHGAAMTPGEVHDALSGARTLAYTTVMTILVRLHAKGLVTRERRGRAYAYQPVESRAEYAARRMNEVLDTAGDRAGALASFVGSIPARERARLRALLECMSK